MRNHYGKSILNLKASETLILWANLTCAVLIIASILIRNRQQEIIIIALAIGIIVMSILLKIFASYKRKSHQLLHSLVNETNEGLFITTPDFKFKYVNPAMCLKSGYSEQEMLNMSTMDLFNEDEQIKIVERQSDRQKGIDDVYETQALNKDGTPIHIRVSSKSLIKDDEFKGIYGMVSDITDYKELEDRLSMVLNNSPDLIYRWCMKNSRFDYVSPSVKEVLGFSEEEFSALTIEDFEKVIYVEDVKKRKKLFNKLLSRSLSESTQFQDNYRWHHPEKGTRWMQSSNTLVIGDSDEVKSSIGVVRDITEKIEVEALILEYQNQLEEMVNQRTEELKIAKEIAERANEAKTQFLANISHELRTPIQAILGFSILGEEKITERTRDRLQGYFKEIRSSGQRMFKLVEDLLDLSRMEKAKLTYQKANCNLAEVVNDVVGQYFEQEMHDKNLTLTLNADELPEVYCDQKRISQVMVNLFSNAVKFSHPQSSITVSFQVSTNSVTAIVNNEGIVIPADELDTIFDPFVQSTNTENGAGGTGLGLSISKRIIEDHGGKIWSEKNPIGATLKFKLPLKRSKYEKDIAC